MLGKFRKICKLQPKVAEVDNLLPIKQKVKHILWEKDDKRLKYVNYAYSLGWLKFIALLEAENGLWSIDRRSNIGYVRKWKTYYDYWFCQISEYYHPNIYNDPKFYTDWKWQIDKCYKLYKWGTKFYGINNIHKTKKRFLTKL